MKKYSIWIVALRILCTSLWNIYLFIYSTQKQVMRLHNRRDKYLSHSKIGSVWKPIGALMIECKPWCKHKTVFAVDGIKSLNVFFRRFKNFSAWEPPLKWLLVRQIVCHRLCDLYSIFFLIQWTNLNNSKNVVSFKMSWIVASKLIYLRWSQTSMI